MEIRNTQKIDSGTTEILKNISTYSRKIGKKIRVQLLKGSFITLKYIMNIIIVCEFSQNFLLLR